MFPFKLSTCQPTYNHGLVPSVHRLVFMKAIWYKFRGYQMSMINTNPLCYKSLKFCLSRRRDEEVPLIGTKNVYLFKSLSDAGELYFLYVKYTTSEWTLSSTYGHCVRNLRYPPQRFCSVTFCCTLTHFRFRFLKNLTLEQGLCNLKLFAWIFSGKYKYLFYVLWTKSAWDESARSHQATWMIHLCHRSSLVEHIYAWSL